MTLDGKLGFVIEGIVYRAFLIAYEIESPRLLSKICAKAACVVREMFDQYLMA